MKANYSVTLFILYYFTIVFGGVCCRQDSDKNEANELILQVDRRPANVLSANPLLNRLQNRELPSQEASTFSIRRRPSQVINDYFI